MGKIELNWKLRITRKYSNFWLPVNAKTMLVWTAPKCNWYSILGLHFYVEALKHMTKESVDHLHLLPEKTWAVSSLRGRLHKCNVLSVCRLVANRSFCIYGRTHLSRWRCVWLYKCEKCKGYHQFIWKSPSVNTTNTPLSISKYHHEVCKW